MKKITQYKKLGKSQNKNPFKSVIYNMKKRAKEGTRQNLKTYNQANPIVPVDVVLFTQGSTFIVKTPTNEKMPDGYYTFANDAEKFWTPFNWNYYQAWFDGAAYPFQYKDMVVRLVRSDTKESVTVLADTVRTRAPGQSNGSYHPVVFGLQNGGTITASVWHEDRQRIQTYKNLTCDKSMDISLNHVRLVFKYEGVEYDNCFVYFKVGTSQFDLSNPKGKYWNRVYNTFGL